MTTIQAIVQRLRVLPEPVQREVLLFAEFLETREKEYGNESERNGWSNFSVCAAMRGMEEEPALYSAADIKEFLQ